MPGSTATSLREFSLAEEAPQARVNGVSQSSGKFIVFPASTFSAGGTALLELSPVRRWLALGRRNIYWMGPSFGTELGDIAGETQFLLAEHLEGHLSVVLPLIDGDLRFCIEGSQGGVRVAAHGDLARHSRPEVTALYVAEGNCLFEIVRQSVRAVSRRLQSFLPRDAKPSPSFLDHFGWCTWNAFYDTVTADKIADGLETWKVCDFMPGLLIVDDGWLDRCGDYLNAFPASPSVFPAGLADFSAFVRRTFGVKMFGIWHAFQGYWGGINPQGPLGGRFRTVPNRGKIRPWEENNGKESDLFLVHPEEAPGFYAEFYRYLRASGIDFVKVDGQSATEVFSHGVLGRVDVMKAYQQAFQAAGSKEFGSEVLHCMAHGNDVIWHCRSSNAMRSSDDYRPLHDDSWQQQHLVDNAYNSLLIGQVAFADWDMFQSHRPHSTYHAAARALSGGPIYVSDEPGKQNVALLEKLVRFDGRTTRTLRCPQPSSITRDRVLRDCQRERCLLKIFNHVNGIGLLGLFHVSSEGETIVDSFSPGDVEGLAGTRFAVWRHNARSLEVAGLHEIFRQRLDAMQWEIAVISPIAAGIAPIGLIEKFNSPAAIADFVQNVSDVRFDVLDGGAFAFYSVRCPEAVEIDGRIVKYSHDAPSGLLTFLVPARRIASVVIFWR